MSDLRPGTSPPERGSGSLLRHGRVWKFRVPQPTNTGRSFIDLPNDAELLSVGMQYDEQEGAVMVVWALVKEDASQTHAHRLIVANTGQDVPGFPEMARFLGTITHEGVVWHVWDGDNDRV